MKLKELRQIIREEIGNFGPKETTTPDPSSPVRVVEYAHRKFGRTMIQVVYVLTENKEEAIQKSKKKVGSDFKLLRAEYLAQWDWLDESEQELFDEDGVAVFEPERD